MFKFLPLLLIAISGYIFLKSTYRFNILLARTPKVEFPILIVIAGLVVSIFGYSLIDMINRIIELTVSQFPCISFISIVQPYLTGITEVALATPTNNPNYSIVLFLLQAAVLSLAALALSKLVNASDERRGKGRFYLSTTALLEHGNEFDEIFVESMTGFKIVNVTLKNRKSYIGFVAEIPDPKKDTTHIRILPVYSGYRDEKTFELKIVEDYESAYLNNKSFDMADFLVVISTDEIITVSFFKKDAYNYFSKNKFSLNLKNVNVTGEPTRYSPDSDIPIL